MRGGGVVGALATEFTVGGAFVLGLVIGLVVGRTFGNRHDFRMFYVASRDIRKPKIDHDGQSGLGSDTNDVAP